MKIFVRWKNRKILLSTNSMGNVFFKDKYFGYDDAIYTGIRILELMHLGYDITTFYNNLKQSFTTPEIKVECSDDKKFVIIKNIIEKLKIQYKKEHILLIDGVRINTLLGWYIIRASNTENAIIIRVETQSDSDKISDNLSKCQIICFGTVIVHI